MTTSRLSLGRTRRARAGRILLTIWLIVVPVSMGAFLFNGEHIGNPAWHPHARFHVAK